MTCARQIDGVREVRFNPAAGSVAVTYRPSLTVRTEIHRVLEASLTADGAVPTVESVAA